VAEHHQCGIIIAPSLDYMDEAWRDAKVGRNGFAECAGRGI
jgi:hypothetical protein